jgi:hypothetical protein
MGRASDAQKAERLNRARMLLRESAPMPEAVERLARECSISAGKRIATCSRPCN